MKQVYLAVCLTLGAASRASGAQADSSSFILGTINGQPADVILLNGGGSGGASAARVFAEEGGQGVVDLGIVNAVGGDSLDAFFLDGSLYFTNAAPLPGECHACASHIAVQRFHLRNYKLVSDRVITVDAPTTNSYPLFKSQVKERAIAAYKKRGY